MNVDENGFIYGETSRIPVAEDLLSTQIQAKKPQLSPAEWRRAANEELNFSNDSDITPEPEPVPEPEFGFVPQPDPEPLVSEPVEEPEPEPEPEPVKEQYIPYGRQTLEPSAEAIAAAEAAQAPDLEKKVEEEKLADAKRYRDENLRQTVANRGKAKDKRKKRPTRHTASPKTAFLVARLVLSLVVVGVICASGIPRVQAALELARNSEADASYVDLDIGESSELPSVVSGKKIEVSRDYRYIDADKLSAMEPNDLAIWYLTEFPIDSLYNQQEYAEFNLWFTDQAGANMDFSFNFQEAVKYVNEHPELLHPVVEEPEPEEPEPVVQTPNQPQQQVQNPVQQTPSNASALPENFDSYSAAQVANWVYATFPNNTNWSMKDYSALTEYYAWLDKKPASFSEMVNGYLDCLGWVGF